MNEKSIEAMVRGSLYKENHNGNRLSDIILGGQDGLVNVLGVLPGVAAASLDTRIVIAAGLAAAFAESIFGVGAIKATMTVGKWGKSGLQMAVIGMVSALAGYGIGLLFQVS